MPTGRAALSSRWHRTDQTSYSPRRALLFGDASPSGHLPETFPASPGQGVAGGATVLNPSLQFPGNGTNVDYTEGIDVGYRYYDTHHQNPLFPFGYGLSYTTFAYSGVRLHPGPRGSSAGDPAERWLVLADELD